MIIKSMHAKNCRLEARVLRALAGPYEITPDPDCGFCPYGAVCRVVVPLPRALS